MYFILNAFPERQKLTNEENPLGLPRPREDCRLGLKNDGADCTAAAHLRRASTRPPRARELSEAAQRDIGPRAAARRLGAGGLQVGARGAAEGRQERAGLRLAADGDRLRGAGG